MNLPTDTIRRIENRLQRLYGDASPALLRRFSHLIGRYGVGPGNCPDPKPLWTEKEVILITYADMIQREGSPPLAVLREFAGKHLKQAFRTIHILPFYPWSSDDGFSVIDYRAVDPRYGKWKDIEALATDFRLMFDLVLNHCSAQSRWFKDYITGIAPARYYFLPTDPELDLSAVVRPRPWPLLTSTRTRDGKAHVWTTFSEDQVDLNWKNPDVLFEFLDILLFYLSKGASILRLDAVAFMWKEIGTNCLHRPETHELVKLFRDVLDLVEPPCLLLTETNVPHAENLSYFGDRDEAHMVYNFSLPPLLLHSLLRSDATELTRWAASLPELCSEQTFLNFTASHDGIGVRPLQGLLPDNEVQWLVNQVLNRGGRVSAKRNSDGTESPYELNITYRSALTIPDSPDLSVGRFLCSQAILLAFKGVPALYFHSLVGTPNDEAAADATGQPRAINRRRYQVAELDAILNLENHPQRRIFTTLQSWLRKRTSHTVFHPDAPMQVLDLGPSLFAFERRCPESGHRLLALFSVSCDSVELPIPSLPPDYQRGAVDLLTGKTIKPTSSNSLKLKPYQALWLYR
jgi:glycosidase